MIELLNRILKRRASNENLIISVLILYLYVLDFKLLVSINELRFDACVKEKILNDKQTQ